VHRLELHELLAASIMMMLQSQAACAVLRSLCATHDAQLLTNAFQISLVLFLSQWYQGLP
jgi:hypothetical protein